MINQVALKYFHAFGEELNNNYSTLENWMHFKQKKGNESDMGVPFGEMYRVQEGIVEKEAG